jgi:hypothetical protein
VKSPVKTVSVRTRQCPSLCRSLVCKAGFSHPDLFRCFTLEARVSSQSVTIANLERTGLDHVTGGATAGRRNLLLKQDSESSRRFSVVNVGPTHFPMNLVVDRSLFQVPSHGILIEPHHRMKIGSAIDSKLKVKLRIPVGKSFAKNFAVEKFFATVSNTARHQSGVSLGQAKRIHTNVIGPSFFSSPWVERKKQILSRPQVSREHNRFCSPQANRANRNPAWCRARVHCVSCTANV